MIFLNKKICALAAHIKLGLKSLPETNAAAYFAS
jgi:hypothetical protein